MPVENILVSLRGADHEEKITDLGKGTHSVFSSFSSPLLAWELILSLDLILRHPVMKHNQRVIRLPRSQTAALITISVIHSAVIIYLLHCWPAYLRLAGVTTLALVGSATRRLKRTLGFHCCLLIYFNPYDFLGIVDRIKKWKKNGEKMNFDPQVQFLPDWCECSVPSPSTLRWPRHGDVCIHKYSCSRMNTSTLMQPDIAHATIPLCNHPRTMVPVWEQNDSAATKSEKGLSCSLCCSSLCDNHS